MPHRGQTVPKDSAEEACLHAVCNAGRYLPEAIESILKQTFKDFEFLILDDASTDDSLEIARRYAHVDRRIEVYPLEHHGYPSLLNEALNLAGGHYYARMDADDVVSPDRLANQVEYLKSHPECVAVGTQVVTIDSDGEPVQHTSLPLDHEEIDERQLAGRYQMVHGSLMMRTEMVRRVGGYHPKFEPAEDYDLLLRLAEIGKLANLGACLYSYRMHPNQITARTYARRALLLRPYSRTAWKVFLTLSWPQAIRLRPAFTPSSTVQGVGPDLLSGNNTGESGPTNRT